MTTGEAVVSGLLVALAAAAPVAAQDQPSPSPLSLRTDARWIAAAVVVNPADTPLNPGNATLRIPRSTWQADMRINARLERGSRWQLVARPRVTVSVEDRVVAAPSATGARRQARFELTEAYLAWQPAEGLSITYGLQNFQWGPAEMMGPSNRMFHEIGVFRDALYSVRGKHLARVNLSSGQQWSLVALAELGATDEEPFRSGSTFRRAAQAKLEYTTRSGSFYAGATAGARGGEPPWAGGYASAAMSDVFSIYADASVQRGSQAWYPAPIGAPTAFAASDRSGGARVLALAGVRAAVSASLDARLEYLRQDAGYSRAQTTAAPATILQRPSAEAVDRWMAPGLEFLGRDLVFVSVLSRSLPPAERLELHGRAVHSLTDRSGAVFVTASLAASDALVVFASLTLSLGPELAEFTRLARSGGVAGISWSW